MTWASFKRPCLLPLAPIPDIGDVAPVVPAVLDGDSRPFYLIFLRHVGCPFAELMLRRARDLAADERVAVVVVSHGGEGETAVWLEALGGAGALLLVHDPARELYAAWGLGVTSWQHFAGWRSLRGVAQLAWQGIRNRRPSGSRWQMGGVFKIDVERRVVWRHLPTHAGDVPEEI